MIKATYVPWFLVLPWTKTHLWSFLSDLFSPMLVWLYRLAQERCKWYCLVRNVQDHGKLCCIMRALWLVHSYVCCSGWHIWAMLELYWQCYSNNYSVFIVMWLELFYGHCFVSVTWLMLYGGLNGISNSVLILLCWHCYLTYTTVGNSWKVALQCIYYRIVLEVWPGQ